MSEQKTSLADSKFDAGLDELAGEVIASYDDLTPVISVKTVLRERLLPLLEAAENVSDAAIKTRAHLAHAVERLEGEVEKWLK